MPRTNKYASSVCAPLFCTAISMQAHAQVVYDVHRLAVIPWRYADTEAADISNNGEVAGYVNARGNIYHAAKWTVDNQIIDLGIIDTDRQTIGKGINNLGHVVGSAHLANLTSQGFLWTPEDGMQLLGTVHSWSSAVDANDSDQVVGYSGGAVNEAFFWSHDTGMLGLGDIPTNQFFSKALCINESGVIAGYGTGDRGDSQAVYWTPEHELVVLPNIPGGGYAVTCQAIDESGRVVGGAIRPQGNRPYLWDPQTGFQILPLPPGCDWGGWAHDINEHGEVLGESFVGDFDFCDGWVWSAQRGLRIISERVSPCQQGQFQFNGFMAINDRGQIVARDHDPPQGVRLDPYIAADTNLDGATDLYDLAVVLTHFGENGGNVTYEIGDVDEDFDVDLDDLAHVLIRFGTHCPDATP